MKRMLKREWYGRYVKLNVDIESKGGTIFRTGEIMIVTRNFNGLHLEKAVKCKECTSHHRERMRGILEYHVTLMPEGYLPDKKGPFIVELKPQELEDVFSALNHFQRTVDKEVCPLIIKSMNKLQNKLWLIKREG